MQGWIKLHRQLSENSLWLLKPFSEGQAWVDLLLLTSYEGGFIKTKNGTIVKVNRGECGYSKLTLSDRWGWSRGKVTRFLSLLEREKMIQQKNSENSTIISILNYEIFQNNTINDTINNTINGQQTIQQTDTIKKEKKYKNNKNKEEVEEERLKIASNFYGEYSNVYLSPKNYDKMKSFVLNEVVLNELINELSETIASKSDRYKPYDENFPDAHFMYLKKFWEFRKNNPAKFTTIPQNKKVDIRSIIDKAIEEGSKKYGHK